SGERLVVPHRAEDLPHLLREGDVLRALEQHQVRLRAVREVVRDPEAVREDAPAVEALHRGELPYAKAGREVGPQSEEGRRGRLRGRERAVRVESLARERVREEAGPVELPRDDLPLREEVPEAG